jgi:predicted metal-binding membrane protein
VSHLHSYGLGLSLVVWTVMMSAMMLPGYLPWVKVHASIARNDGNNPIKATVTLLAGYLTAWIAYSAVAATVQLSLHEYALINSNLQLTNVAAGLLLIAAGVFQFTSLKSACLSKCRNPMSFMLAQSHDGRINSYTLGLQQGAFCVGCCWALMGLGFVVGVMNIWGMVGLTVLVTVEKLAGYGKRFGQLAGMTLVIWGVFLL